MPKVRVICPECLTNGVEAVFRSKHAHHKHAVSAHTSAKGGCAAMADSVCAWYDRWGSKVMVFEGRKLATMVDGLAKRRDFSLLKALQKSEFDDKGDQDWVRSIKIPDKQEAS